MRQGADHSPTSLDRHRYHAVVALLGRLRHELASPLSGASLHLELARRRLSEREPDPVAAHESVSQAQREVAFASALLDVLAAGARIAGAEPAELSPAVAVARGATRLRGEAAARGISLRTPEPEPERILGFPGLLEDAVEAVTAEAVCRATEGTTVVWSVQRSREEIRLACRFTGSMPAVSPEKIFGAARSGAEADPSLLLARCTVESHGGTLGVAASAPAVEFVITLPNNVESREISHAVPRQGEA